MRWLRLAEGFHIWLLLGDSLYSQHPGMWLKQNSSQFTCIWLWASKTTKTIEVSTAMDDFCQPQLQSLAWAFTMIAACSCKGRRVDDLGDTWNHFYSLNRENPGLFILVIAMMTPISRSFLIDTIIVVSRFHCVFSSTSITVESLSNARVPVMRCSMKLSLRSSAKIGPLRRLEAVSRSRFQA